MYFIKYRKDLDSFGTEDQNKYYQATVMINIIVASLTSSFCSLRFKINGEERLRIYIYVSLVPSAGYFDSNSFINHWILMDVLSLLIFKLGTFFKALGQQWM